MTDSKSAKRPKAAEKMLNRRSVRKMESINSVWDLMATTGTAGSAAAAT